MSTVPTERPQTDTKIMVVDSATALLYLLDNTGIISTDHPSLYINLEGVKLGRHGSIFIISLYIVRIKKIYLIDIHRLGKTAFSTTNSGGTMSLKTILESAAIPKVVFDIRNASDALFSHFQISVNGIQDLQLMELATRRFSKDLVAELGECVERECPISAAAKAKWRRAKEDARRLYDPIRGGRYEIFNERPMRPEIIQSCAWDVALLPELYDVYNAKLSPSGQAFWQAQVRGSTEERIKLSQSPGYDGEAECKVRGPWNMYEIGRAIDSWNDDVVRAAFYGDFEDDRVDDYDDDYGDDFGTARDCMGWEEDMIKNGEYF